MFKLARIIANLAGAPEIGPAHLAEMPQYWVAPREDLINGLLPAEIARQHLTMPELLGFCALLITSNETTTNLLGNALLCLAERPEV